MSTIPDTASRVLVVDDHPLVRRGLVELIGAEPDLEICAEAGSKGEALDLIRDMGPDLVVLDLSLEDGSGLELIKQLRTEDAELPVLVCSMHDELLCGERALRAGAMGFVGKHEPSETIVRAIRQILEGGIYLSSSLAGRVLHRFVGRPGDDRPSPIETLSNRELEVLGMIADGTSSSGIAERLGLSVKTIDTYREHIKDKLGLDNANELLRYAVIWKREST